MILLIRILFVAGKKSALLRSFLLATDNQFKHVRKGI